jgi:hypothetical protein
MTCTLAYTSDIPQSKGGSSMEEIMKEILPLLEAIQENQQKIITMLTPAFGSVSGRNTDRDSETE